MISHFADPRTPRQSAEAVIRRARLMNDPDMMRRGQQLLKYAEEQESLDRESPRPSQIYEASKFDKGGSAVEGMYVGGQIMGLLVVAFWFLTIFFSWKVVAVGFFATALVVGAGFGVYETIKRARQ